MSILSIEHLSISASSNHIVSLTRQGQLWQEREQERAFSPLTSLSMLSLGYRCAGSCLSPFTSLFSWWSGVRAVNSLPKANRQATAKRQSPFLLPHTPPLCFLLNLLCRWAPVKSGLHYRPPSPRLRMCSPLSAPTRIQNTATLPGVCVCVQAAIVLFGVQLCEMQGMWMGFHFCFISVRLLSNV